MPTIMNRDLNASTRRRSVVCFIVIALLGLASAHGVAAEADGTLRAELKLGPTESAFRPSVHGFKFTNSELSAEISKVFKDPDPEWADLERMWVLVGLFDPEEICVGDTGGEDSDGDCIPIAGANKWIEEHIKSMGNGVCEGMIVAALAFWRAELGGDEVLRKALRDHFEVDVTKKSRDWLDELDHGGARDLVIYGFATQFVASVTEPTDEWQKKPASQHVKTLIDAMNRYVQPDARDFSELYTLGMYRQDGENPGRLKHGHSVLPYKVTEMSSGEFRIFVYDSNHPKNDDLYVHIKGNEWTYQPEPDTTWSGDAGSKSLELTPWSAREMRQEYYFDCPFCQTAAPDQAPIEVFLSGEGELLIMSRGPNAAAAGYDPETDEYVDELSVDTDSFKGGLDEDVPDLYRLPPDSDGYSIFVFDPWSRGKSEAEDTSDLVIVSAGVTIVIEGLELAGQLALDVLVKNTADGPFVRVEGLGSEPFIIPSIYIADDGDADDPDASHEFEFKDVAVSEDVGFEFGLSKVNDGLLFRRWRSDDHAPSSDDSDEQFTSYDLEATRIDASWDSVLTMPGILVADTETVFFDRAEWRKVDEDELELSEIPIYFVDDVDVIAILEDGAAQREEQTGVAANRIPKNRRKSGSGNAKSGTQRGTSSYAISKRAHNAQKGKGR